MWPRTYKVYVLATENASDAAIEHITGVLLGDDDCIVVTKQPDRTIKAANGKGYKYEGCKVRVREAQCIQELQDRFNLDNYKYRLKKIS